MKAARKLPSLGFVIVMLAMLWVLRDIAYPAQAFRTTVNGMPVHVSYAAHHTDFLGKQLAGLPAFLPCSVRVNMDARFMEAYGYDGYLTWMLAHEIGHCMERQLPGGKSTLTSSLADADDSPRVQRSEAFADAWATLYIARCGVDLTPLGYPRVNSTDPVLTDEDFQAARTCVPKATDVQAEGNPLYTLSVLRALHGLAADGRNPRRRSEVYQREAAALGINVAAPPPPNFGVEGQAPVPRPH